MSDAEKMKEITRGIDAIALVIPASLANPADGFQYAKNVIDASEKNGVKLIFFWNTSSYLAPERIGVQFVIIEPPIYAENLLAPYTTDYVKKKKSSLPNSRRYAYWLNCL